MWGEGVWKSYEENESQNQSTQQMMNCQQSGSNLAVMVR